MTLCLFLLQFLTIEKLIPNNCFHERLFLLLPALDNDFSFHTSFIPAIILSQVTSGPQQTEAAESHTREMLSCETWGDRDLGVTQSQILDRRICFQPKENAEGFKCVDACLCMHTETRGNCGKPCSITLYLTALGQVLSPNLQFNIFKPKWWSSLCSLAPQGWGYRHVAGAIYTRSRDLKPLSLFPERSQFIFDCVCMCVCVRV